MPVTVDVGQVDLRRSDRVLVLPDHVEVLGSDRVCRRVALVGIEQYVALRAGDDEKGSFGVVNCLRDVALAQVVGLRLREERMDFHECRPVPLQVLSGGSLRSGTRERAPADPAPGQQHELLSGRVVDIAQIDDGHVFRDPVKKVGAAQKSDLPLEIHDEMPGRLVLLPRRRVAV